MYVHVYVYMYLSIRFHFGKRRKEKRKHFRRFMGRQNGSFVLSLLSARL